MKKRTALFLLLSIAALPLSGQSRPIITVLDFTTEAMSPNEMKTVISLLSSALFQSGQFTVIDVTQRESLLKEIEFSGSGCTDEACALKIGKMLSAGMIVVGHISKIGSRFVVSTKMLETESGTTLSTADGIYKDMDAMVDGMRDLAAALASKKASPGNVVASRPTSDSGLRFWTGLASGIAGIGLLGTGGWFLYDGLVNGTASVDAAWNAYFASTSDQASYYAQYELKFGDWVDGLWLGGGLTAGGAILTGLGIVLMMPEAPKPAVAVRVLPLADALLLSVSLRF